MTTAISLLEVQNLRVTRGNVQILDIPTFHLGDNEFVSLIGPNGSGKSTLLLSLMGLLKRDSGSITYKGKEIRSDASLLDFRRRIAMVLQEPLLFDTTVYENVASGLKIRGLGRSETRQRVETYLERFNLTGMARRSARKLSGGEARRVSLARAFAVEPDLIFFDEPFANLDPPTRQSLIDDMERIIRETGIAALLVTHDPAEALRMSDRVLVMHGGKIVQNGSPANVMNRPENGFVANFVGMETIIEGVVRQNADKLLTISVSGHEIEAIGDLLPGEKAYCCIRPENVIVSVANTGVTSSTRNAFPARIVEITSLGPFLRLKLECGFPLTAYLTCESFTSLGLAEGKEVFASFKATSVHLIRKNH
jgi:tungstate transport system ATP-binding protein